MKTDLILQEQPPMYSDEELNKMCEDLMIQQEEENQRKAILRSLTHANNKLWRSNKNFKNKKRFNN